MNNVHLNYFLAPLTESNTKEKVKQRRERLMAASNQEGFKTLVSVLSTMKTCSKGNASSSRVVSETADERVWAVQLLAKQYGTDYLIDREKMRSIRASLVFERNRFSRIVTVELLQDVVCENEVKQDAVVDKTKRGLGAKKNSYLTTFGLFSLVNQAAGRKRRRRCITMSTI